MSAADYRLCDVCSAKVFYDASLNYERATEAEPSAKIAGVEPAYYGYRLMNLGDWAVLCRECATTHRTAIVPCG